MQYRLHYFLSIFFLFTYINFCANSYAAVIPCRSYDVKEGLSENSVRCMYQDKLGYMWFGTKDGLSCYNGREFTVYGNSSENNHLNIEFILPHIDGKRLWIASRTSLEIFNPDDGSRRVIDLSNIGFTKEFRTLCYDLSEKLWVGSNSGIVVLEESFAESYKVINVHKGLGDDKVAALHKDSSGNIWIGTENGLYKYNAKTLNFKEIGKGNKESFLCFSEDEHGMIWTGTWNDGLYCINPQNENIDILFSPQQDNFQHYKIPIIRSIYHLDQTKMIICSNSGLYSYNKQSGQLEQLQLTTGLSNDSFYSCLRDNEGGLWIGTYFNGACYISPKAQQLDLFRSDDNINMSGTAIGRLCQENEDLLWVCSENGGLSLLNIKEKSFVKIPWQNPDENIHAICRIYDDLWLGTFNSGIKRINLKTKISQTLNLSQDKNSDNANSVYSLYANEKEGKVYIGSRKGCKIYNYRSNTFIEIEQLKNLIIYEIFEDYTGKLWFSCYGRGLYCFDKHSNRWKIYRNIANDTSSISGNRIINIYADAKNQLWLSDEGNGICRYDYTTDCFVRPKINTKNGELPCNVIFGILDDDNGNLWMSSNIGIIKLNPESGEYRLLTHEDGLQSNQFNYRSSYKTTDGKFWFGGIDGLSSFYPEDIKDNKVSPRIVATVQYSDKKVKISETRDVSIPSNVSSFSINFDCLSYSSPSRTVFEYSFDKNSNWIRTEQTSVSFADIRPGKYIFRVRAINSDGYVSQNECKINLKLNAPFYKSTVAYIIYSFLALALIAYAIRMIIRWRKKEEIRKSYNAKLQFFTQIAHEIKTPVTLIKAPLELVMEHKKWDTETEENLNLISANTKRLLELIHQLLDFKKVSSEGYRINKTNTNVLSIINNVVIRFKPLLSKGKQLKVIFEGKEEDYEGLLDEEALTKIISNLVGNASKYTKDLINIKLEREEKENDKYIFIQVDDNGPGIPEDEVNKIFDSFYQIQSSDTKNRKPGFGIGLSLVKLLVDKHNGDVYIDKNYKEGCRVCVRIPWEPKNEILEVVETEPGINILLVEDNPDILNFIYKNLKDQYNIIKAKDGVKALSKLERHNVDIIISDISMPNMDGFELLQKVRENPIISHIPFIILSAETSLESKIKSLDIGADAYIEKPFSINHFKAVIENQLNKKQKLIEKFGGKTEIEESKYGTLDAEWMKKLDSIILENISEVNFSVLDLSNSMYISRSNLQRKLKALTGMVPNEYIKLIKLKKAAELLTQDNYRINEVCYMCGFNTPSYFTSCFQKHFGILPKDFIALNKPNQVSHLH